MISPTAAITCYRERQSDDGRRRHEKAIIQCPAGAEQRVDHHTGDDDD